MIFDCTNLRAHSNPHPEFLLSIKTCEDFVKDQKKNDFTKCLL